MLNDSQTPGLGGPETAQVPVSVSCGLPAVQLQRLWSGCFPAECDSPPQLGLHVLKRCGSWPDGCGHGETWHPAQRGSGAGEWLLLANAVCVTELQCIIMGLPGTLSLHY